MVSNYRTIRWLLCGTPEYVGSIGVESLFIPFAPDTDPDPEEFP